MTAAQPDITTLDVVREWIGASNLTGLTEGTISRAYRSAESYVGTRCEWAVPPADDLAWVWPPAPDDLVQAVAMQTARLLARRQSVDGFVGMGEFGPARVTFTDRDIDRLMAPWRRVVMA